MTKTFDEQLAEEVEELCSRPIVGLTPEQMTRFIDHRAQHALRILKARPTGGANTMYLDFGRQLTEEVGAEEGE